MQYPLNRVLTTWQKLVHILITWHSIFLLQFCHRYIPEVSKYVPEYYGECGRMIVVQPGGKPLESFLQKSWKVHYIQCCTEKSILLWLGDVYRVYIWFVTLIMIGRPLTANLRWRPFSSVPHVSDRLELYNNNRASWILHPGPSESDVYSDVVQEAQWNNLLYTARLLMRLDTPLHGNNARGAKYAVYYASVATHTVFENIKMAALRAMSKEKCCSPFPCFFVPCDRTFLLYPSCRTTYPTASIFRHLLKL